MQPPTSPASAAAAPAGTTTRELWLDVARGVTIVLVVLLHADLMLESVGERSTVVHLGALALFPLRMPLFFLVSGILGAAVLTRPARRVLTDRVGHFLWVWAVWTVIGYAVVGGLVFPALGLDGVYGFVDMRLDPAKHLATSNSWAWFLYALALFFATALALRRLPPPAHMAVALALAAPGMLGLGMGVLDRFYHYPYFAAGLLGGAAIREAAPRLGRWRVLLPLLLAWAAATAAAHKLGWLTTTPGRFALSFLAVPAALSAAALVADSRWSWPLRVVGTNTLVVYLLHPYLLRLLVEVERPDLVPRWGWSAAVVLAAAALALAAGPALAKVPGLTSPPWRPPGRPVPAEA